VVTGKAEKHKNAAEVMQAPQDGFGSLGEQAHLDAAQLGWGQAASSIWTPDGPTDAGPAISPLYLADNGAQEQQLFSNTNTATFADQLPFPGNAGNEITPSATIGMAEPEAQPPLWLSASPRASTPLPNTPLPTTGWTPDAPLHNSAASTSLNSFSRPSEGRRSLLASKLTPRFGFTISGAFILTGMLLLIFVFLMSLSLPSPSFTSSSQTAPLTPTTMNTQKTPGARETAAPDPTTSPTAGAFSAQQFIDNAQTASAVNTSTATAIKVAISFKVHQQIYVTFAVHANQSGMVCLMWFLNGKQFDHYEFAMASVSTSAYSYTTASTPGTGYIQIYWATRPDCSDKELAQQVNFTVTA